MVLARRKDINSIVSERRRELRDLPTVLVPVWQIKIRERFGINVDREIAKYIVLAAHENGTWKRQRATRKIERLLIERGESKENSARIAKEIIDLVIGTPEY
ncbi:MULTISPECIES: hypothetical protein [unclassified Thermoplasma]|uniref:hypothetical protein n=1 Tax=unclassified Thermoplasma TaxID=2684908 RepID=UPI000D8F6643|nr:MULTISPECIES: hypothetical protein [unclassified Thermoplasma]PYB67770.1 hypothetical protein DMB44_07770 [Thermoplasma sp. Kam2015]